LSGYSRPVGKISGYKNLRNKSTKFGKEETKYEKEHKIYTISNKI